METSEASFALRGDAPFAVHIRLTPQALAAIRAAAPSGDQAQLRLDSAAGRAVLTVGTHEFGFRAPQDQGCVIVRTVPGGGTASMVGRVEHRLKPLRSLGDASAAATAAQPLSQPAPATPLDVPINFDELEAAEAAEAAAPAALPRRPPVLSPLVPASARAVAAARRGALRLVLIALLSERSASLRGVRQELAAVAVEVPSFKQPAGKGELELALKAVATYKAPGTYVLKAGLEGEVRDLPGGAASSGERAGGKRRRQDAEDMEVGPSPAARRASTPSLPSGAVTGDGSGGGGVVSSRRAGSRPLSSSSGRGSDSTDEPWVAYHAERLPQPPPALTDRAAYAAAAEEFNRRYESYFKLHQLLAANRRDFEALQAAADGAANPAERAAAEAEIERLWARREARARRWEAAFRVLQAELTEWKAALGAFGQARGSAAAGAPVTAGGEEVI